jgi:hypothetical protein
MSTYYTTVYIGSCTLLKYQQLISCLYCKINIAVIEGKVSVYISRDKIDDISTLTVDTMKHTLTCVINFEHGVIHACIRHYKYYILQTNRKFVISIFVTELKVQVSQERWKKLLLLLCKIERFIY